MVTDLQQNANEENAQLSTGPITEKGKEISKYNAQKHAILRESITEYEEEMHSYVFDKLVKEFNPQGVIEEMLVERICICYLKLYRVAKAEKEYFKSIFDPLHRINSRWDIPVLPDPDAEWVGYNPKIRAENIEKITNVYGRYETTIENRLYKALHELERVQRMRKGDTVTAPIAVDVAGGEKMGSFGENA